MEELGRPGLANRCPFARLGVLAIRSAIHEGETQMGLETSKVLLARQRESADRIARLVSEAQERSPAGAARRHRITQSLRLARRRLRALAAAQRTVAALE